MWQLVAIASVAAAAAAVSDPSAAPDTEPPGKDSREQVICRSDPATGSRVRRERICRTKEQWAVQREENRRDLDRGLANRPTQGQ